MARVLSLLHRAWTRILFSEKDEHALMNSETIFDAINNGDVNLVAEFISSGMDLNDTFRDGESPLHVAAGLGRTEIVRMLLDAGCAIDALPKHGGGDTALFYAIVGGHFETCELLIHRLRSLSLSTLWWCNGRDPLHAAVAENQLDILRMMLDTRIFNIFSETDNGHNVFDIAAQHGHWDIVALILQPGYLPLTSSAEHLKIRGFILAVVNGYLSLAAHILEHIGNVDDPDIIGNVYNRDIIGYPFLVLAVRTGCVEAVQMLIDRGVDVNIESAPNANRIIPLGMAITGGNAAIVQMLLGHGAKVPLFQLPYHVDSPLRDAVAHGHVDILKLLLQHDPKVELTPSFRNHLLQLAVLNGHYDMAVYMISIGADARAQNKEIGTALHSIRSTAVKKGTAYALASLFIAHGADVDALGEEGNTPLHAAATHGCYGVAWLLIQHGADVTVRNFKGETPLHSAAFRGSPSVVELLIIHGADVNARDGRQNTPLHCAMSTRCAWVVEYLLCHGAKVNARNAHKETPVLVLCKYSTNSYITGCGCCNEIHRCASFLRILKSRGADTNKCDDLGLNPLFYAASRCKLQEIKMLVNKRTNFTLCNFEKSGILHESICNRDTNVIPFLISMGVDMNARTKYNGTPLRIAAVRHNESAVAALVAAGADVNAGSTRGTSALMELAGNNVNIAKMLLLANVGPVSIPRLTQWSTVDETLAEFGFHVNAVHHRHRMVVMPELTRTFTTDEQFMAEKYANSCDRLIDESIRAHCDVSVLRHLAMTVYISKAEFMTQATKHLSLAVAERGWAECRDPRIATKHVQCRLPIELVVMIAHMATEPGSLPVGSKCCKPFL